MGDMGEFYNDLKDRRRVLRDRYGVNCPRCITARPKASPSILLPQQRCRVDGYVDPREPLTDEQALIVSRGPSATVGAE